jgi:predicted DNA-binding ribbon-helix-helix protein
VFVLIKKVFNHTVFAAKGRSGGLFMQIGILKRSIVIAHHKTSVSLEDQFWNGLKEIADARQQSISGIVTMIKMAHEQGNLSSAIRQFVLAYYRERTPVGAVGGRSGNS